MNTEHEITKLKTEVATIKQQIEDLDRVLVAMRQSALLVNDMIERAKGVTPRVSELRKAAKGK